MRLDGVYAVAVRADRREAVASRDGLSVNARMEGLRNSGVALAAGVRHIELRDGRFRVVGGENFVGTMAVRADGGLG